MIRVLARSFLVLAVAVAASGCGYDTSATFNADGSVVIGLKFLFPTSLMNGSTGGSVSGFTPDDITKANQQLQSKYPGGRVFAITGGDESGAGITIPFRNEKSAFTFLTSPSALSPAALGGTSSSSSGIDLANSGGLFATATHTTAGQTDTYTFTTVPQPFPSPSPGETISLTPDEVDGIFTVTFSLSVPNEITSAPDALFSLDRKTATWKVSLIHAQTLTATTGLSSAAAGSSSGTSSTRSSLWVLFAVGLVAIVVGFALGVFSPMRRGRAMAPAPVATPDAAGWSGPPPEPPPSAGPPATP